MHAVPGHWIPAATQVCGGNAGHLIIASRYLETYDNVQAGGCLMLHAWPSLFRFHLLPDHLSGSQLSARSGAAP